MDRSHLAFLIGKALIAFSDFVRAQPFKAESVTVYRPKSSGNSYELLSRPDLRDALFLHQEERLQLPAASALMDYLWEHGGHKLTISVDNGNPDRAGWTSAAFHMIVPNALWRLWDEYSIRSLSTTGNWQPWELPNGVLDQLAADIASIEAGKGGKVKITVPFLQVDIPDDEAFELESGVTLRRWTQSDMAYYLHCNERVYPYDDFGPYWSKSYLEIVVNSQVVFASLEGRDRQAAVEDLVGAILGRVKWAIMQATDPTQLIVELPATTEIQQSITGIFPVRRQHSRRMLAGSIRLDTSTCQSVADLLSCLTSAVKQFPDIQEVIWMLDRATLALLPRDILFESAIGLERILVAGSGENTRRFRNYGTALLAKGDTLTTSENLKKIYSLRSSAAHGAGAQQRRYEELSTTARTYLSEAIERVVRLVAASKLWSAGGDAVSVALERYLLSLFYAAAKDDLGYMNSNSTSAPA